MELGSHKYKVVIRASKQHWGLPSLVGGRIWNRQKSSGHAYMSGGTTRATGQAIRAR